MKTLDQLRAECDAAKAAWKAAQNAKSAACAKWLAARDRWRAAYNAAERAKEMEAGR